MANPYRGEVSVELNGKAHLMRLPLGILAELEESLGAESLVQLVERFEQGAFRAKDVLVLLAAGLKGAGSEISADLLAVAEFAGGAVGAAKAAARLLRVTFALPDEGA